MRRWVMAIIAIAVAGLVIGRLRAEDGGRFFPETGHAINADYGFQAFWEAHDGATTLGPPITDLVFEANVPVQYFERGRLEQHGTTVEPGPVGRERSRWRTLPPQPAKLDSDFQQFWEQHEGPALLGAPLGGPAWESLNGATVRVQYFERGRLERHAGFTGSAVVVGQIGREIALARGLINADQTITRNLGPVKPDRQPAPFSSLLPTPTPLPPTPTPVPAEPPAPAAPIATGKVIDVNLSTQSLVAYSDGVPAYRALVATGKDGFETPTGTYAIYTKLDLQTMRGSLNGEDWVVPDVPHVMYINGSVALHGTYWHNLFGTGVRMSHGCVNLSLQDAAWLYGWAPVGTKVVVHY